jgi:hypothetical protein
MAEYILLITYMIGFSRPRDRNANNASNEQAQRRHDRATSVMSDALKYLNTDWRRKRLGHRCVRDSAGRKCCRNRSVFLTHGSMASLNS